jgi:AcrR family transcriptional regulator
MAPRTSARAARSALTPGSILDAALAVARREGVAGLTIRKLASELQVTPMAVYHHFDNKESILLGVIDRVVGEAAVTVHGVAADRPHDWLRASFRSMYDAMVEQPGVISLLGQSMLVGPNARAVLEEVLGVLQRMGLDLAGSVRGFHALMSYTLGAVSLRVRVQVDSGAHARLSSELSRLASHDSFDAGLEVVLEGLPAAGATPRITPSA